MNTSKLSAFVLLLFLMGTTVQAQTETRSPGKFTGVNSEGSWDVIITLGDKDEVKLVSKGFDLGEVITEIENGSLNIELEDSDDDKRANFTAYVTVRNLESLGLSGSGNMIVRSDISSHEFSIGQAGSGTIEMEMLTTGELNIGMAGSGSVLIASGTASDVNIGQVGSGDLKALALLGKDVNVGKTGSGDTYIGVEGDLTVGSLGSGNVYYSGDPTDISKGSLGSGKVVRK
ncbi:Putative auto-transporter adhesin, head GIN domain [Algoriphagus locisalis]|uniref:Putative auto-transporter adhesin, head GIN domain n=1 Tax=Algoriphagus locisalis TaxID=305507 RepID=A0A1I7BMM5_9BACT|nr:head GIN domain-containing protein [Algoriphagus locisalis]SFT88419.1 Putative auto-transporter adhesin, head GIN domain [Algoriphagus locisalis]